MNVCGAHSPAAHHSASVKVTYVTLENPPPPPRASKEAVRGHVSKVPDPGLPTAHPGIPCHSGRYIIEREIEFSIMSASTEERKYFNA